MNKQNNNNSNNSPSSEEMMECLERSGYMLESKIVQDLNKAGFFVEPNQALLDERTGKTREIDIIAEFYSCKPEHMDVFVKTNFVIEVINNTYPFVLTTPRIWTPNTPSDDYLRYATTPDEDNDDHFLHQLDIFEIRGNENQKVFSQYCAFTRKKDNKLMANHPDDVYSSFLKMSEYSLDSIGHWSNSMSDNYWRLFFWQPILVLRNNLNIVTKEPGEEECLASVISGKLEFNFFFRNKPETIIIDVVIQPHLLKVLQEYIKQDELLEEKIYSIRKANNESSL